MSAVLADIAPDDRVVGGQSLGPALEQNQPALAVHPEQAEVVGILVVARDPVSPRDHLDKDGVRIIGPDNRIGPGRNLSAEPGMEVPSRDHIDVTGQPHRPEEEAEASGEAGKHDPGRPLRPNVLDPQGSQPAHERHGDADAKRKMNHGANQGLRGAVENPILIEHHMQRGLLAVLGASFGPGAIGSSKPGIADMEPFRRHGRFFRGEPPPLDEGRVSWTSCATSGSR